MTEEYNITTSRGRARLRRISRSLKDSDLKDVNFVVGRTFKKKLKPDDKEEKEFNPGDKPPKGLLHKEVMSLMRAGYLLPQTELPERTAKQRERSDVARKRRLDSEKQRGIVTKEKTAAAKKKREEREKHVEKVKARNLQSAANRAESRKVSRFKAYMEGGLSEAEAESVVWPEKKKPKKATSKPAPKLVPKPTPKLPKVSSGPTTDKGVPSVDPGLTPVVDKPKTRPKTSKD